MSASTSMLVILIQFCLSLRALSLGGRHEELRAELRTNWRGHLGRLCLLVALSNAH